jgi:hypothetical protein
MNPQDKLNTQHHGTQAVELIRRVCVHLHQSGNPRLALQIEALRVAEMTIDIEVKHCG